MGFWWRQLGVLASVLLGALFLWAGWGWVAALGFLAGIQAFVMLRRLWQEFRLARWLENPDEVDPPDATGTWGDIFYRLQKLQRRQKASRGQLTSALEQFLRLGQPAEPAPRVGAMMLAPSVMLASDIVQVDRCPQPGGLLHSARRRHESQAVDENPSDVGLAVEVTTVAEQRWRRHQVGLRQRISSLRATMSVVRPK